MKITIEIETDDSGRAIRARVVSGGVRKERKKRTMIAEGAKGDSVQLQQVREFVARHGHDGAAKLLKVSRAAVYQWLYRGRVPAWQTERINEINSEDGL